LYFLDTVALSAILSTDKALTRYDSSDRIGVGLSEPVNIAGVIGRKTANMYINNKINDKLYTKDELDILNKIDIELANR
jgi:hypothetical protein